MGKLKKRRACVRWSRGGPIEGFVWLHQERETWSSYYSKLFLSHDSQLYCQKNSLKNVLANEIVGFGGLNLFIY
jgi:hypothetical protein